MTHLLRLLARVEAGEEIVIARDGTPIARLVPFEPRVERASGAWKGWIDVAADFDDELPDDWSEGLDEVLPRKAW